MSNYNQFNSNSDIVMEALESKYRQDYNESSPYFEASTKGWGERQWILYSSFRTRLGEMK